MPPRPPSRGSDFFVPEREGALSASAAATDLRANIAAILSGGDKEEPLPSARGGEGGEGSGSGSASSPFALRAGYAFSAASAPASPAGDHPAARQGSAWASQSASRAERSSRGTVTQKALETPPPRPDVPRAGALLRSPSASHGADAASAFGAVVATLESAKKLMVGAGFSTAAGSPSAFENRAARWTPSASAPRALDPAAAAAALGASAAKGASRRGKENDAAAGAPRRALEW